MVAYKVVSLGVRVRIPLVTLLPARSSVGQSTPLIRVGSLVRIQPGGFFRKEDFMEKIDFEPMERQAREHAEETGIDYDDLLYSSQFECRFSRR